MTMTINEAKVLIAEEFIAKFKEWLADFNNDEMSENEYGHKYGWRKSNNDGTKPVRKDNQQSVIWFQGHIYSGRYLDRWADVGIDRQMVRELHRAGFFSYDYCTSYKARMLGKTDFYYISQAKAKEIYKAYKNGFFNKERESK